jgi:hypothetical protein
MAEPLLSGQAATRMSRRHVPAGNRPELRRGGVRPGPQLRTGSARGRAGLQAHWLCALRRPVEFAVSSEVDTKGWSGGPMVAHLRLTPSTQDKASTAG